MKSFWTSQTFHFSLDAANNHLHFSCHLQNQLKFVRPALIIWRIRLSRKNQANKITQKAAMRCDAMQCNATFRHRVRFYQRQRVIPKLTTQNQGKQDDKQMRIETSHWAGKFPKLYSFAFTEKRKQRRQTFFILIPANTTRTLMSCIVIHFKTSLFKNDLNFVEWVPLALSGCLQSKQQSKMLYTNPEGDERNRAFRGHSSYHTSF